MPTPSSISKTSIAFGSILPQRNFNNTNYRYGFNGIEKDNELFGNGNYYHTDHRQFDSRLARWHSTDPKEDHPRIIGWSPFSFSYNNPLVFIDSEGDIPWDKVLAVFKKVTSEQGFRKDPYTGEKQGHGGMDLSVNTGTEVKVMADGEVVKVGWDSKIIKGKTRGYGRYIIVKHKNGYYTLYAHLEKDGSKVKVGDKVKDGDVIATSGNTGGSTGPHLHLEVIKANSLGEVFNWENKMNPRDFGDLQAFLENGGNLNSTSNTEPKSNSNSLELKNFYQTNINWADEMLNSMKELNSNGVFDNLIQKMQEYRNDQNTKLDDLNKADVQ